MEGLKKWLATNVLMRLLANRLVLVALSAGLSALATVGLLDPDVAAQLQAVLG